MEYLLYFLLWLTVSAVATHVLWVYYLAVMHLKKRRDTLDWKLHPLRTFNAYTVLAVGWTLDFVVQVTSAFNLLGPPRELTVSARMERYAERGNRVQAWFALEFCPRFLDPYDPDGDHC